MTPDEIRAELLREHAELREMIEAARVVAGQVRAGESLRRELKANVLLLAEALSAHNTREEELLRGTVDRGDGAGTTGTEIVNEQHFEEHEALRAALLDVNLDPDDYWVAKNMIGALEQLLHHMAHEERTFLDSGTSR